MGIVVIIVGAAVVIGLGALVFVATQRGGDRRQGGDGGYAGTWSTGGAGDYGGSDRDGRDSDAGFGGEGGGSEGSDGGGSDGGGGDGGGGGGGD